MFVFLRYRLLHNGKLLYQTVLYHMAEKAVKRVMTVKPLK